MWWKCFGRRPNSLDYRSPLHHPEYIQSPAKGPGEREKSRLCFSFYITFTTTLLPKSRQDRLRCRYKASRRSLGSAEPPALPTRLTSFAMFHNAQGFNIVDMPPWTYKLRGLSGRRNVIRANMHSTARRLLASFSLRMNDLVQGEHGFPRMIIRFVLTDKRRWLIRPGAGNRRPSCPGAVAIRLEPLLANLLSRSASTLPSLLISAKPSSGSPCALATRG